MANQARCTRCNGNMLISDDIYGRFRSCMQCGRTEELTDLGSLDELLAATLGPQRARLGLAPLRAG